MLTELGKRRKKFSKLSALERERLYKLDRLGLKPSQIARELERHRSTVLRELTRNKDYVDRNTFYLERAGAAQRATHARRVQASKSRIRLKSIEIQEFCAKCLECGVSPVNISLRLKLEKPGLSISAQAIYDWIHHEREDLKRCLEIAGKSRRRRISRGKGQKKQAAAPKKSIETRPVEAEQRQEIGHFEQDTIVSGKGVSDSAIGNIVCRASRKLNLVPTSTLNSEEYSKRLIEVLLAKVPQAMRRTLTNDNGPENAAHKKLERELKIEVFFTHPYCASERGTVENRNRVLRKFLPKGIDLSKVPGDLLLEIENHINNSPMKVLQGRTPNEVWDYALVNKGLVDLQRTPIKPFSLSVKPQRFAENFACYPP